MNIKTPNQQIREEIQSLEILRVSISFRMSKAWSRLKYKHDWGWLSFIISSEKTLEIEYKFYYDIYYKLEDYIECLSKQIKY